MVSMGTEDSRAFLVHGAQRWRWCDVAAAFTRGDFDLTDQFGEDLGAGAVFGTLAMLGRCPLRMAGHQFLLPRRACHRNEESSERRDEELVDAASPVSSG
jgi:hypothetical protein